MGKRNCSDGPSAPRVAIVAGDGGFEFPIVGESHYQNNLETVAGKKTKNGAHHRCIAALFPEPTNPYDQNAVRVDVEGKTVGYLGRDDAAIFLTSLFGGGFAAGVANAIIVGGWNRGRGQIGSFGIKLDVVIPFALAAAHSPTEPTQRIFSSIEKPTLAGPPPLPNPSPPPLPKASPPPLPTVQFPVTKKKRTWPVVVVALILVFVAFNFLSSNSKGEKVVAVLSSQFGSICNPKIEGLFSDTLRLDWTAATKKLDIITVMAAIGGAKSNIYASGIRYLKFPNSSGSYNIIDWKTGEKTSVGERAPYYFP